MDRAAREKFDADQKKIQDEKEAAQAAQISFQKEANLARHRQDLAFKLGPEPEKGADVTHVCVDIFVSLSNKQRNKNFGHYVASCYCEYAIVWVFLTDYFLWFPYACLIYLEPSEFSVFFLLFSPYYLKRNYTDNLFSSIYYLQVAVRLPSGERKERRFMNTTKVKALYDYIESLHSFESVTFLLISNFPRVVYGPDKFELTLNDAGLHPSASLFVQVQES